MGTWLPLWLDGRRANAKQLGDQEDWGEPLPRPSLDEVDGVCKTCKSAAGLCHDCINPKAILQLLEELRVRFTDLLMAFEASCVKPLCWAHMMVLRPKPSGGHRTIGLTVAPLRVLSRLRRPFAQKWENEHDADYFWGCQGKACDRAAWAHSILVAAAKGRQQSAASLLLDLAKFYEHVGHDHLWEEGIKTGFPRRLLACWCASYEGWRFFEADKCATFPFWAFGTILPGCRGATTAAKLMLATLLETVSSRLPSYRLWNVVDDISGHVAGTDRMVQAITAEAARLLVDGLQARDLPLSKGKSKVLINGSDRLKLGLLRQLEEQGIDETAAARNVGADLLLGSRRRAYVAKGRVAKAAKRSRRIRQLRKAGAHTRNLTLTGSNAGVLWGFEVLGFTPSQLKSIRVDAAKATYRLSREQNAATTMLANAQAAGAKNVDPAFRHHRRVVLAWATGGLGRHAGSRHDAGGLARRHRQAQPPQKALVQRDGCRSHFRAHLAAAWLECAVGEAPHHPQRHEDRSSGRGAQDSWFLGRPGNLGLDGQFSTLGQLQGPTFLGRHQAAARLWPFRGLDALASERAGQAGGARHLDTGEARQTPGRRRGQLPALPRSAVHNVPPLLRVPGFVLGEGHACLTRGATGGTFSRAAIQGTVCARHLPFPGHYLANRCTRKGLPSLVAQPTSRSALGGAYLHRRLFCGQRYAAASRLGSSRCRRSGQPQGRGLWSGAVRRTSGANFAPRRGLCAGYGRAVHDGPAHFAHRLRRYHRHSQRPKVQSIGGYTPPSARLEQASGFPRPGQGNQGQGARHTARRGGRAVNFPFQEGKRFRRPFCQETGRCSQAIPDRQDSGGLRLLGPAGCAAHVLLRLRGWDDTKAAAPGKRTRPARGRLKRKFKAEAAAPASGLVCDWLAPHVPSAFSHGSPFDPRSFRGHSLQLGPVFDAGGRVLDRRIVFCAKCGAMYWERADALCRSCKQHPGGCASQLRKLRSGLFPNKRNPGWTVELVRRPTLDEANTLVAQLESCEAGLGRSVLGPTTPQENKSRPTGSIAVALATRRWDCGRV